MKERLKEKIKEAQKSLDEATSKTAQKKFTRQVTSLNEVLASEDELQKYYHNWKTFQASDHLPLWVEIKIDFSDEYLNYLEGY